MSEARIGIFLRLRPPRKSAGRVVADTEGNLVEFNVPKDAAQGLINNSKENYKFHFDGVFAPDAQQDAVFEGVARPAIQDALEGINGTIFAYGQTGSGKTFTVTGGTERYADRGLIPRALAAVFAEIQKRTTHTFTVQISYLELYNEEGYDLLDPTREVKHLDDLPKVFVMEDDDARMHVRNLSTHRTNNEEEALNLLFLGDTNRMVAETPLNQASSRSHAIFTIQIEARKAGEDKVRRSKLNFVDLAGSERVTKTGIDGAILKEAKFINLSLHFLEQVIIALQEKRPHIPYRNSLLTQMLRDSLGGNCRTLMIANVVPETQHVEESISTCRFAQRVAMISNKVTVNEELDPTLVIRRLKQENLQLRQELQLLKGCGGGEQEAGEGAEQTQQQAQPQLAEEEQARLWQQVQAFVEDASPDASLDVEGSMLVIRTAFSILKSMVKDSRAAGPAKSRKVLGGPQEPPAAAGQGPTAADGGTNEDTELDLPSKVERLRTVLRQKEGEVVLLAGMLRRQGAHPQAATVAGRAASPGFGEQKLANNGALRPTNGSAAQPQQPLHNPATAFDDALLVDKNRAFEYFCSSSPTHDAIQENKLILKSKYDDAKGLGAQVNASKQRIGELKSLIEQRRVQRSMAALMQGQQLPEGEDPEEDRTKGLIEKEKGMYRQALGQLKQLKSEIDQLQAMLDHSRGRLQKEFHAWYGIMLGQLTLEQRQRMEAQQAQQAQDQAADWHIAAVPAGSQAAPGGGTQFATVGLQGQGQAAAPGSSGGGLPLQQPGALPGMTAAGPALAMPQQALMTAQQQQQGWEAGTVSWPAAQPPIRQGTAQQRPHSRQAAVPSASSFVPPAFTAWSGAQLTASLGSGRQQQQQPWGSAVSQSRPQTPWQVQQLGLTPIGQSQTAAPASAGSMKTPYSSSGPAMGAGTGRGSTGLGPGCTAAPAGPAAEPVAQQGPDYGAVDPEVLAAARPLLTGNPAADADIIKFYQARAALLKSHSYR